MAATQPTRSRPIRVRPSKDAEDRSVQTVVSEVVTLSVDYAKQEIRDPLKGLAERLVWGSMAMLLIGFGTVMIAIAGLRALQTETGTMFTGSLSWAPYAIVLLGAVAVLGLVATIKLKGRA